jgi:glycogen debranching enzyme
MSYMPSALVYLPICRETAVMDARPAVDDAALERTALAVLDANWTGSVTVPAPGLYPHQWNLDSTLVAVGLAARPERAARARAELAGLLSAQWRDGMIPHIVFRPGNGYFPGPAVWRSDVCPNAPSGVATSGLTQPPLHAYAVWRIWRRLPCDRTAAFVRRMWPRLVAQHEYLTRSRDLGGAGLAAIVHPWESGMDDSPAWDAPLAALPCGAGQHEDRYVWLVERYRDSGYDPAYLRAEHAFAVEDPFFNGAWLASTWAMTRLAEHAGADAGPYREAAERIRAALLARLWDAEDGFRARDLRADRIIPVRTIGGFAPMLDPELPADVVDALADLLESPRFMGAAGYPVPSCEVRAAEFDRTRYWRGPSWVSANWMVRQAAITHGRRSLAAALQTSTLRLVRQSGFRECFDPFDGVGRGCRDFSCSAALTIDLLAPPIG